MKTGKKEVHGAAKRGSQRRSEYIAWDKMKQRCNNPNTSNYKNYGARGVKVCDRWSESFKNFIADMGEKPSPNHSLDRFPDVNGNYEPSNCRWATYKEQQRNRRDNRNITLNGETRTMSEWCEIKNIPKYLVSCRINSLKWSPSKALSFQSSTILRLNQHHAERIRAINESGIKQTEIAKMYNVSTTTISKIINKKTYGK